LPPGARQSTNTLSIHQVQIHRQRLFERLLNGVLGDFIKHQPEELGPVFGLRLELFLQVKADRLPFAIRIGCQVDVIHTLGRRPQFADQFLLAFNHFIDRFEVVINVHRQILFRQILHMSEGCLHHELLAEVLTDRFRLRRRFDDDETLFHMITMCFLDFQGDESETSEILPRSALC
jgi:hypothetical protein